MADVDLSRSYSQIVAQGEALNTSMLRTSFEPIRSTVTQRLKRPRVKILRTNNTKNRSNAVSIPAFLNSKRQINV